MKKGLALLLCVCLALTALAGCSGKTKEMQKVTVCEVTHSIFYAPQYVALAKGFFADEGLDVELSNGGGADKVMSAVLSGNVDIGFAGPEASIYVYNEGKEDYTEVFAQVTKRTPALPGISWRASTSCRAARAACRIWRLSMPSAKTAWTRRPTCCWTTASSSTT